MRRARGLDRRRFAPSAATVFAVARNDEQRVVDPQREAHTSTSAEDAARPAGDIVRGFYEALEAGQLSQALGVLARDVVWVEAEGSPYGGESALEGRHAVWEGLLAPLDAEWDGLEMLCEDVVQAGSAVLVIGRYRGTTAGAVAASTLR